MPLPSTPMTHTYLLHMYILTAMVLARLLFGHAIQACTARPLLPLPCTALYPTTHASAIHTDDTHVHTTHIHNIPYPPHALGAWCLALTGARQGCASVCWSPRPLIMATLGCNHPPSPHTITTSYTNYTAPISHVCATPMCAYTWSKFSRATFTAV